MLAQVWVEVVQLLEQVGQLVVWAVLVVFELESGQPGTLQCPVVLV